MVVSEWDNGIKILCDWFIVAVGIALGRLYEEIYVISKYDSLGCIYWDVAKILPMILQKYFFRGSTKGIFPTYIFFLYE